MDFRRQIVTCLFPMLRLSFETQKVKENYAILLLKRQAFQTQMPGVFMTNTRHFGSKLTVFRKQTRGIPETDLAG